MLGYCMHDQLATHPQSVIFKFLLQSAEMNFYAVANHSVALRWLARVRYTHFLPCSSFFQRSDE